VTADPATGEPYRRIKRTMESISGRVRQEAGSLDRSEVNAFVAEIIATHKNRHRIFLLGEGRSGLVARSFAMRLMHLGFDVYVFGAVVTSNTDSSLGKIATNTVTIRGRTEADETSFLERQVTGVSISLTPLGTLFEINVMVFLDSVIAGLIAALQKKEEELEERHSDLRAQREVLTANPHDAHRE